MSAPMTRADGAAVSSPAGTVPTRIAAFWGLGAFGTTTMLNALSLVLLYFLVNIVKMEPVIAGGLLFATKVFDAVTDPPMGMISDRTRSRWGRRRPWFLVGSFICGLSFALLFNVPEGAGLDAAYVYTGAVLLLFTLGYTVFTVPYMAMPGEMTDDYHERNRLMSWRTVFMTVGTLTGGAGAPGLVAALGNDRAAYGEMGIILGIVVFLAMFFTFLGTAGARQVPRDPEPVSFFRNLVLLGRNLPLLVLLATKVALYVGLAAFTAVMLFFFSSVLKSGPAALGIYFVTFSAATILFTPVMVWVGRRVEKKRAYLVCLTAYGLGMLSWLAATPGEPLPLVLARAIWLGGLNAGLFLYGYSMLVDTYAWDAKVTGLRREGFLASTISFVEKFSMAVGPLVIGALLSSMGFDKDLAPTDDQSPSAVQAMVIGFVWIPFGCQLVAAGLLYWYRLGRRDLAS
jgi:GPH family glycoside/pentoside/hexuronide:cation symporter